MASSARTVTRSNAHELALWCGGRVAIEEDALDPSIRRVGINVPVGDEVQRAYEGDMIIHGKDGNFSIFRQ